MWASQRLGLACFVSIPDVSEGLTMLTLGQTEVFIANDSQFKFSLCSVLSPSVPYTCSSWKSFPTNHTNLSLNIFSLSYCNNSLCGFLSVLLLPNVFPAPRARMILKYKSDNVILFHGFSSLLKYKVLSKAHRAQQGLPLASASASSPTSLPHGYQLPDLPANLPMSNTFPSQGLGSFCSLYLECSSHNINMICSFSSCRSPVKCHLTRGVYYVYLNKTVLHPYLLNFSP